MQWKAMSSAGMSLFQRPLIVYQCGIYRQLVATISTVLRFQWLRFQRCLASQLMAHCVG